MQTLFAIHDTDPEHLAAVVEQMRAMGSPRLRVVDCGDYLMALEGTHRIAAAAHLGVALDLDVLSQDDLVDADSLDWQDLQSGEQYTAGELAGEVFSPRATAYLVDHAGMVVTQ